MSHSSKIFEAQPIRVQNLNGFDLSHMNSGTAYCGTLTPVLTYLAMQETRFSLGCAVQVELPPLATAAFGRVDVHIECFWTRCSILYGGWKQFISNNPETSFISGAGIVEHYDLPVFHPSNFDAATGSLVSSLDASNYGLLDYVGFPVNSAIIGRSLVNVNRDILLMPLLNYHKIWDCFYRNPQVTRTVFAVNPDTSGPGFTHSVAFIHHSYVYAGTATSPSGSSNQFNSASDTTFPDGISVFSLRQRNWANDYFTAGSLKPFQNGLTPQVEFTVDLNTGDGAVTLSAMRMVNSLGKFYEANNYDPTYEGIGRANYGHKPDDAGMDQPVYLGRLVVPVYQKGVYLSAASGTDGDTGDGHNPFINGSLGSGVASGLIGAKAASASFNGSGEICKNFHCGAWGYITGIFSLVPHAQYSFGVERHMLRTQIGDYAFPALQSVGMDSVKNYEVYASSTNVAADTDFSYIGRYSSYKYINDRVVGELRPGRSLDGFIIQRNFASAPAFNTSFMEIPISALDELFALASSSMKFSCWYEVYWVFKAVMPLAEFCVPTLGELQDSHTIRVKQGGSKL